MKKQPSKPAKKAAVKPAKKKTVKTASKIQRKVITEKDVSRVSYNVELSRGDMALITNALSWVMFTTAFQGMPHQYKIKHRKLFKEFEKVLDKK